MKLILIYIYAIQYFQSIVLTTVAVATFQELTAPCGPVAAILTTKS